MSELMDRDALSERFGDDSELILEVANMFLEDCPGLLERLEDAVQHRQPEEILQTAHKLKGAVANFSSIVAERILELEERGARSVLEGVDELSKEVSALVKRLEAEVALHFAS